MTGRFEHCEALVREFDRERFLATLFAPADRRSDLFALYAFDLETAAVAGRVRDPVAGEIRFQWWQDTVSGRTDDPGHPAAEALIAVLRKHAIGNARALALIDARRAALYAQELSDAEFELQASETAGAIIEMASLILDRAPGETMRLASHHAGVATMAAHAQGEGRKAFARKHLAAVRALVGGLPVTVLPAFLPLALAAQALARPALPQWRKQWVLWRASKNLAAWL